MFGNDLIDNIVITRESLGVTRQQFSTVLLLGSTKTDQSLIKEYYSLQEVLIDYPPSDENVATEEYKACLALFQQQPSISKVLIVQKLENETLLQSYIRYMNSGKYAYCVIIVTPIAEDKLKELVALIQTKEQIIALNITDAQVPLATFFKTSNYNRVVSIFADANNMAYPNCAVMGAILAKDPGTTNLSLLPVIGIIPASLTKEKKAAYVLNNINYYDYFQGSIARIGANCGQVASGESFQFIYMIDWIATTIKENISNLFLSKSIIPFNKVGLTLISIAIQKALNKAEDQRLIEPINETNIIMPDLSSISSQDKIDGILKGVKFYFTATGSIKHIGGIYGIVTDGANIL